MADYLRRYAICPFYKRNGQHYVKCEGGTQLIFPDEQIESEHLKLFCCDRWRECSVAIFLNKYYERQDDQ